MNESIEINPSILQTYNFLFHTFRYFYKRFKNGSDFPCTLV